MKHVKPVSKALLGPTFGIIDLLQLLLTLGLLDFSAKKPNNNNNM